MKNLLNISNLQSDDLLSILNYSKELNSSFDSCLRGKYWFNFRKKFNTN